MAVAITYCSAEVGIDAPLITVEVDVSPGLPQVQIVGLPETAVRESKDRVRAAIVSSGLTFPDKRITVNLAPADLPKTGGRYDLAIAIAILAANRDIKTTKLTSHEFLGELSLTGKLRKVRGVLPAALRPQAKQRTLVVPKANNDEAAFSGAAHVRLSHSLRQVVDYLTTNEPLPVPTTTKRQHLDKPRLCLADVKGQLAAKRALMIAASGAHNLLMIGPPGTGKTMLAARLPSLLPAMTKAEALEAAAIASVSRQPFDSTTWQHRPFRSPHHTSSAMAMVGGSSPPRPGEISLAHRGVLFLDELPEYSRSVLEVLREPLESAEIWISRAAHQVRYPADFQLIAAMNPCPCGYFGDDRHECDCSADRIHRYRARLSGPLLDRIDIHIEVPPLPPGSLDQIKVDTETDDTFYKRVDETRQCMLSRQGVVNSRLQGRDISRYCALKNKDQKHLEEAVLKLGISMRGYQKIIRVARTIADFAGDRQIAMPHLTEALNYRKLDRLK